VFFVYEVVTDYTRYRQNRMDVSSDISTQERAFGKQRIYTSTLSLPFWYAYSDDTLSLTYDSPDEPSVRGLYCTNF
jgi:hypothetical protein